MFEVTFEPSVADGDVSRKKQAVSRAARRPSNIWMSSLSAEPRGNKQHFGPFCQEQSMLQAEPVAPATNYLPV